MSVEITKINEKKQLGIKTLKKFKKGEIIFTETPIISCQFSYNKDYFTACSHCLKSLDSASELLEYLCTGQREHERKSDGNEYEVYKEEKVSIFSCECGEIFCSEKCYEDAKYHKFICLNSLESGYNLKEINLNALRKLEELWKSIHYPPEETSIMLVVRMICVLLVEQEVLVEQEEKIDNGKDKGKEKFDLGVFSSFAHLTSTCNNSDTLLHRFLSKENLKEIHLLLIQTFEKVFPEINNFDLFLRLFSIVALNGQGIGCSSLWDYERKVSALVDDYEKKKAEENKNEDPSNLTSLEYEKYKQSLAKITSLQEKIDENSGEFVNVEGTGIYSLHSKLNHSCVPNAEIRFTEGINLLSCIALSDINEQEEVCISYLEFDDECDGCDEEGCEEEDLNEGATEEYSKGEEGDSGFDEGCASDCSLDELDAKEERKRLLREFYLFECDCPICL